jgi:hypothetical protein
VYDLRILIMLLRKKRREGILVGLVHNGLDFGINSKKLVSNNKFRNVNDARCQ